jgi:Tol biopolymer transport system component
LFALAAAACGTSTSEPENGPIASRFEGTIYLVEPDGSRERRGLPALRGAADFEWSPGGERLAFTKGAERLDLYVAGADGRNARLLVRNAEAPAWSPDGESLVFMRFVCTEPNACTDVGNPYELFSTAADGGTPRRLTSNTGYDGRPAWSPDGETIVLETDDGLTLMRPDGSERRRLTKGGLHSHPSWSPDGQLIAFDDFDDVYVVAPDGRRPRRLTRGPGPEFSPDWSPDGRLMAFLTNPTCARRGGCTAHEPWLVRVMNADGTSPRDVTGLGWGPPNWRPRLRED